MKTILVVDDDAAIVDALTEFLSGEGYRAVARRAPTMGSRNW